MPNPRTQKPGRPHLARDRQQWIFDYVVQQSGAVYHWWSENDERLPKEVRSHAMISKHLGREAIAREAEAAAAAESGDRAKALKLYFSATKLFMRAQHPIFENNGEKLFLYEGLQRCYAKVHELADYKIERIDVPWNGTTVSGWLHLCPDVGAEPAPLVFYFPGCDVTCESFPDPTKNPMHARGMHIFSFDGPGQGQSNIRGIHLTGSNYEEAAAAALDQLLERPEFDPERIVAFGSGMGTFWALRFAAVDHRAKCVATKGTYAHNYYLMNEDGPRWKQLFAYLTQASSEEELDQILDDMILDGHMGSITCPTFMATGEYDLRDPVEEVFTLFDQLQAPGELWVFADQFHKMSLSSGRSVQSLMLDWVQDRLDGKEMPYTGEVLYLEPGGPEPGSPDVPLKRRWYESSR